MGGASYPAGVTSVYGETLKLSTILTSLGIPGIETKQAVIFNPNYDFRLHINPSIMAVLFYDASNGAGARYKTVGTTASLTRDLTDRSSSTGSGTALDSATTSDRLYICLSDIVSGLYFVIISGNTNVMGGTVNYWNGTAWTDIGATDYTKRGGCSLGGSDKITWVVPTDWHAAHLGGVNFDTPVMGMNITDKDAPGIYGFWLQFVPDASVSSDVEIAEIWTLNKNTNRGYFHGGEEYHISFDRRYTGAFEAILESSKIPDESATDDMEITWLRTII